MSRYIDADALKESLKKFEATGNVQGYLQGIRDALNDLFPQIIDDAPTADVEPVKHGQWINCANYNKIDDIISCSYTICSVCEKLQQYGYKTKYCPNCGAIMDGDSE